MDYRGKTVVKRLIGEHVLPHRRALVLAIICMVIVAITTAANAWLLQPALDKIFIAGDRTMLTLIPLAVLVIALINAAAAYGSALYMRYLGTRIVADMQVRLFSHLVHSDVGLFSRESSGRIISRFTNDIMLLRNAFSSVLTGVAREFLSMIFLLGVMIYQNLELTFIAFLAFPFAIWPTIRLGKRMRKVTDTTQEQLGEFSSSLDEVFRGVRTVKAYNREQFEVRRASNTIEGLFRLYFKAARIQAAAAPIMGILSGGAIAGIIWYGGMQVIDGESTPGAFFSFVAAFLMAYKPVRGISGFNTIMQEGISAATRLYKVLDTPPTITNASNAQELHVRGGHIRYDNVSFSYAENGHGVRDITLEVPAGKTAALVGLSGSGKSTLMNLLLRFYDAGQGKITIDGQDVRDVTLESLRTNMSFVPQEPMLFEDTVRANIAYGREDASDVEIVAAASNAAADEFIRTLPQGYDTVLGPHGMTLSGGQRQRIAVARAILKNAPILLLDEATSSLDNESERAIQSSLLKLMKGRTTLVIAHRLSTIVNADIIYVIEDGRVIESGTHETLLNKRSKYHQLYAEHSEIA